MKAFHALGTILIFFMFLFLSGCQNEMLTRDEVDIYPRGYVSFSTEMSDSEYETRSRSMGATTLFSVVNIYEVQGNNEVRVGQMKGADRPFVFVVRPGIHTYLVEYEGLSERVQFSVFEERVTAVSIRFSDVSKQTLSGARLIDSAGETIYCTMSLYVWAPQPYEGP